MAGRLVGRTAIVTGAGQTPGATIGNGRAIALVYAREGARVLCVDRDLARAEETVAMILAEGGRAEAEQADVSSDMDCRTVVAAGLAFGGGRLDILVNNVGIGGGGDGPAHKAEEAAFDRILAVNLKGAWLMTRHALLPMRSHGAGAIVNVSSLASIAGATQIAYEISKAAVNRLTTSVASANAGRGVRCNAILPGFLDTPMAVEGIAAATGQTAEAVREARNARVPLVRRMGTAWDTAHAALFLASDDAGFITGVLLPVDGGMGVRVG